MFDHEDYGDVNDYIERARKAQQNREQKHDVQLEIDDRCDFCRNMLPPNDCVRCARCNHRVHRGMLLWPRLGGICSTCYGEVTGT